MNNKLISFLYGLEKEPKVVSFLLENGSVVSGKFATPKPEGSFYFTDEYEFEGLVLLKSVTVAQGNKAFARLPELRVVKEEIRAWGVGRLKTLKPIQEE
jgi:hypothetical protein